MKNKKIAVIGSHGVGKSTICRKGYDNLYNSFFDQERVKINKDSAYGPTEIDYGFNNKYAVVNETFRDILSDAGLSSEEQKKQSESMTLATYGLQVYKEHLFNLQGKNIISDRSVIDCMIYNDYYKKTSDKYSSHYLYAKVQALFHTKHFYDRVYLIEPSDRPIDDDKFRLTDKEGQKEVHNLFLKYTKDFKKVVIVNQEEQDNIVNEIINFLNV